MKRVKLCALFLNGPRRLFCDCDVGRPHESRPSVEVASGMAECGLECFIGIRYIFSIYFKISFPNQIIDPHSFKAYINQTFYIDTS